MGKQRATTPGRRGRKAARYAVPVAVVAVTAGTIGLAPAFAGGGSPDLPRVTAEELVRRVAAADTEELTGTLRLTTDLGLPELPGPLPGGDGGRQGAPGGGRTSDDGDGSAGREDDGRGSSADPRRRLLELASGTHVLRVAADGPQRQRVSLLEDAAEYSVIRNGEDVWAYDSATHRVHHATVPEHPDGDREKGDRGPHEAAELTPSQLAEKALAAVDDSTAVTVDGTTRVAGRDAYRLVVRPKGAENAESTVGSVRVAVDAERGVPLRFTLHPAGGGEPVVDTAYTEVDFTAPDADAFAFTPPKGAEVTEAEDAPRGGDAPWRAALLPRARVLGEDWHRVLRLTLPGGLPLPALGTTDGGADGLARLLDDATEEVTGEFGTGRVVTTRLVNALLTEDGHVYVGALTPEGLVEVAERAPRHDTRG